MHLAPFNTTRNKAFRDHHLLVYLKVWTTFNSCIRFEQEHMGSCLSTSGFDCLWNGRLKSVQSHTYALMCLLSFRTFFTLSEYQRASICTFKSLQRNVLCVIRGTSSNVFNCCLVPDRSASNQQRYWRHAVQWSETEEDRDDVSKRKFFFSIPTIHNSLASLANMSWILLRTSVICHTSFPCLLSDW